MRATLRAFYTSLPPDHQCAWRLLGHCSGQMTISQLADAAGWTPSHTRQVLDGLVRAHLVNRRNNAYEMNNLISSWGGFHALPHRTRHQGKVSASGKQRENSPLPPTPDLALSRAAQSPA